MAGKLRPRRSVLYMPGSNARALEKARTLPADGLILDLEDAVAPDAKALARDQIAAAVRAGGFGRRELVIRVNALGTPWGADDVAAIANLPIDAVLFPKIEGPAQVRAAVQALDHAGAPPTLPVWAMAETPRAILESASIAAAHPRLTVIVMGTSDLTKDLRARHTPDRLPMLASLSHCLLAARASNLDILDGVHLDLDDEAGFRAACEQGRDMGFDGKTLIHPKQIAIANEVFGPSAQDLDFARRVIAAWQEARRRGEGVVVVDGKLVENLHVEEAKRTLAMAEAIG
jgi:citrate lyase subunit beta/citryl-CoA lyase